MKIRKSKITIFLIAGLVLCVIFIAGNRLERHHLAETTDSVADHSDTVTSKPETGQEQQQFPVILGGATELKPGERLESNQCVYFENDTQEINFSVQCSYGNASKLKIYYGPRENDLSNAIGYFQMQEGEKEAHLTTDISVGTWYFTVENGGSHNIMIDMLTVDC